MTADVNQPSNNGSRAVRRLWLLAAGSLLVYGMIGWLSFSFHYGEDHKDRPILEVLGLFGVATIFYLLGLLVVWKLRSGSAAKVIDPRSPDGRLLPIVIIGSLAFRMVMLFSTPIQEIDFYRYLWDGRVTLAGYSPYQFSPQQIDYWKFGETNRTSRSQLAQLSQRSAALRTIYERVHHREVPTVYPPAAQAIFAFACLLTPVRAELWVHVLVLKAFLIVFDLATLYLLIGLLRRLSLPQSWALAYGWCPLVMKEVANSGHLDSIAVFFTMVCVRLLIEVYFLTQMELSRVRQVRSSAVAQSALALAALGLGVLAKSYPIVLLPVIGAFLLVRLGEKALAPAAVFVVVLVLGYAPFVVLADRAEKREQQTASFYSAPHAPKDPRAKTFGNSNHPGSGLSTFLGRWQMNNLLFMVVHENVRFPQPKDDHWFVIIPKVMRISLNHNLANLSSSFGLLHRGIDPAFLFTQFLMGLLLAGLTVYWARKVYLNPAPMQLLQCVFLTLAWSWLLSAAQNPWYLLWCLPFMLFDGRRTWFLLPSLSLIYYLRFWLEYQNLQTQATVDAAKAFFDFGVVWLEYAPFFVLLVIESLHRMHRKGGFSNVFTPDTITSVGGRSSNHEAAVGK